MFRTHNVNVFSFWFVNILVPCAVKFPATNDLVTGYDLRKGL